jgi:phytoene dehydrogenase-like protein
LIIKYMGNVSRYEAVVIGAGLGGLGAAVELAKNGVKTLLLEQHNLPGGFATSFVRGRFEFEPSLHELGSAGFGDEKRGVRKYFEDEIEAEIDLHRIPEAYRLILTERGLNVRVPFGVAEYIDLIEKHAPGSREPVTKYMGLCREIIEATDYLAKTGLDSNKKTIFKKYGNFIRTLPYTMREVADSLRLSQEAKDILYPYFCYLGVPENRLSFMAYGALLYSYIAYGAVIPGMRSHEIASAMIKKFEFYGGEYRANTRVEKILVEKLQVKGVETTKGEQIDTDFIVSNASPPVVFNGLIYPKNEVPREAFQNLNARTLGVSTFVVYLGLNASPEKLGLDDYSYFISPHMRIDEIYDSVCTLEDPLMQASICLNNAVPDCSPPGTTILSLTAVFRSEAWHGITSADYFHVKNRIAARMITHFEQATDTQLKGHIEEFEVASPATFARYTGGFDGNVYAWEPEPWDSIVPRVLEEERERYIGGLYFGGGFGYRAHGYSGALFSGQKAAQDLIVSGRNK